MRIARASVYLLNAVQRAPFGEIFFPLLPDPFIAFQFLAPLPQNRLITAPVFPRDSKDQTVDGDSQHRTLVNEPVTQFLRLVARFFELFEEQIVDDGLDPRVIYPETPGQVVSVAVNPRSEQVAGFLDRVFIRRDVNQGG